MAVRNIKKKPQTLTLSAVAGSGLEFLQESSLVDIEIIGEEPPEGSLVIIEADSESIASEAARWIAATINNNRFSTDFHDLTPQEDTMVSVSDVEILLDKLRYYPTTRHVVLLPDYGQVQSSVLDKLLILLEDTKISLLVVLCTKSIVKLPKTIVGRSAQTISLRVLSDIDREYKLVASGVSVTAAKEVVYLAGNQPTLTGAFSHSSQIRLFAKSVLLGPDPFGSDILDLFRMYTKLCALSRMIASNENKNSEIKVKDAPKPPPSELRYDNLNPNEKVYAKKLLSLWCYHQRKLALSTLHTGKALLPAVYLVREALRRVDAFESSLTNPTSPVLALAAYLPNKQQKNN